jgi:NAD(P)-dependent dehydrogenase (short-subunit alcohol dehydrogenase family)
MLSGLTVDALLSLKGRVALVTGAGGAIGSATVDRLLEAGADVLCSDLPDCPGPKGVAMEPCDLTDPEAVTALLETIDRKYKRLDYLVHCAGIARDAVLWNMGTVAWHDVLRINLSSAFYLLHGATPLLRQSRGGSIVLMSSINGERGKFGQANYAASKAGLIGLGRTAARELGRFGIRVNIVAPGLIDSPMTADLPPEVREEAIAQTALGRSGTPGDVARAVLFLCSDLSRHITGQVLRVDGGQLMA